MMTWDSWWWIQFNKRWNETKANVHCTQIQTENDISNVYDVWLLRVCCMWNVHIYTGNRIGYIQADSTLNVRSFIIVAYKTQLNAGRFWWVGRRLIFSPRDGPHSSNFQILFTPVRSKRSSNPTGDSLSSIWFIKLVWLKIRNSGILRENKRELSALFVGHIGRNSFVNGYLIGPLLLRWSKYFFLNGNWKRRWILYKVCSAKYWYKIQVPRKSHAFV